MKLADVSVKRPVFAIMMTAALIVLGAVPTCFLGPYLAMLPALAESVLHTGPVGLGTLQGALGAGSFLGAIASGALGDRRRTGGTLVGALVLAGAALAACGASPLFLLSAALLVVAGFAQMVQFGLNQLLVQRRVAPEMRSRVIGVQSFATAGAQPVGAGLAAAAAALLGPGLAMVAGGGAAAAAALVIWGRTRSLAALR
jgi:ENTS family enterobactin (siderophore) exporter